jgi:HAD superfamily hydrolase (TIGR01509 family)
MMPGKFKGKKLVILDCDGVLVRSERANVAYYNHILSRFGLREVAREETEKIRLFHTLSTPQVIEEFFPAELKAEVRAYSDGLDYGLFADMVEPEPGWVETLSSLSESHTFCVATNRGKSATALIERAGLLGYMKKVFTVRDVKNPKPAPDILNLALSHFGISRFEAVYVGDSVLDQRAAMGAGIDFIGFRYNSEDFVSEPSGLAVMLK